MVGGRYAYIRKEALTQKLPSSAHIIITCCVELKIVLLGGSQNLFSASVRVEHVILLTILYQYLLRARKIYLNFNRLLMRTS